MIASELDLTKPSSSQADTHEKKKYKLKRSLQTGDRERPPV